MAIILLLNTYFAIAMTTAALLVVYCLAGVIYRLNFHPLAQFPGPRLARATLWYEFYYDCMLHGQYTFKIGQLHKEYGTYLGFFLYIMALVILKANSLN